MKRTLTAIIALAIAAGLAGMAQAQTSSTTVPAGTAAPSVQTTSPSATAPTATTAVPANPGMAPANPSMTPGAASQASMQPAGGDSFWSRSISQDEVRQAQQQLQAQGLYRGPVDGKAGPEMQRALTRFQQQNGLRRTATLDEQTMSRLGGTGPAMGSSAAPMGGSAPAPAGTAPMATSTAPGASTAAPLGAGGTSATPAAPSGTGGSAPTSTGTQPPTR
jgi:peptidoglycan hydrolase-like protein with peptidoglycan-binding domain